MKKNLIVFLASAAMVTGAAASVQAIGSLPPQALPTNFSVSISNLPESALNSIVALIQNGFQASCTQVYGTKPVIPITNFQYSYDKPTQTFVANAFCDKPKT